MSLQKFQILYLYSLVTLLVHSYLVNSNDSQAHLKFCFAKGACSHLNHVLTQQNSMCFVADCYKPLEITHPSASQSVPHVCVCPPLKQHSVFWLYLHPYVRERPQRDKYLRFPDIMSYHTCFAIYAV